MKPLSCFSIKYYRSYIRTSNSSRSIFYHNGKTHYIVLKLNPIHVQFEFYPQRHNCYILYSHFCYINNILRMKEAEFNKQMEYLVDHVAYIFLISKSYNYGAIYARLRETDDTEAQCI